MKNKIPNKEFVHFLITSTLVQATWTTEVAYQLVYSSLPWLQSILIIASRVILFKNKSYAITFLLKILLVSLSSYNGPQGPMRCPPITSLTSFPASLSLSHSTTATLAYCFLNISGTVPSQGLCTEVTLFRRFIERWPYVKLRPNATPPTLAFTIPPYAAFLFLFSVTITV